MAQRKIQARLGIDVGRVLIAAALPGGGDTSFIGGSMADALATPAYEGMFEHVPELVDRFEGRVWLVSKAGPSVQAKTRQWLRHHRFHERTGIPAENVRFCRERAQKAIHCKQLHITHFIDDRADVLQHLQGIVPHCYLFGPQRKRSLVKAEAVLTWAEAAGLVLRQLQV